MTTHRALGDQVRVYFKDDTSTVLVVLDEEEIQDRIVEMCDRQGWDLLDVVDYSIEQTVYADDYGIDGA